MTRRWKLRWARFLLTLGLRHLLRSVNRKRLMLRELPTPETVTNVTYQMPRGMTGVWVPLRLKASTALNLRTILEDQVILEERIIRRMQVLTRVISKSLRRR